MTGLTVGGEKEASSVKKGLLWQHRDKLFSRWKERYFVLTRDYLICFQKATKGIASSEMGSFIVKMSLAEVESVEWLERKSGPVIVLVLPREGRWLLRSKTELDEWLRALRNTIGESKDRRETLRKTTSRDFHSQILDNGHYLRSKLALHHTLSDSQQEAARVNHAVAKELQGGRIKPTDEHLDTPHMGKRGNRMSLMTDVDVALELSSGDLDTPPSTSSFHWSSSRTPCSTPRGSICQSRPVSRVNEEPACVSNNGFPSLNEQRQDRHLINPSETVVQKKDSGSDKSPVHDQFQVAIRKEIAPNKNSMAASKLQSQPLHVVCSSENVMAEHGQVLVNGEVGSYVNHRPLKSTVNINNYAHHAINQERLSLQKSNSSSSLKKDVGGENSFSDYHRHRQVLESKAVSGDKSSSLEYFLPHAHSSSSVNQLKYNHNGYKNDQYPAKAIVNKSSQIQDASLGISRNSFRRKHPAGTSADVSGTNQYAQKVSQAKQYSEISKPAMNSRVKRSSYSQPDSNESFLRQENHHAQEPLYGSPEYCERIVREDPNKGSSRNCSKTECNQNWKLEDNGKFLRQENPPGISVEVNRNSTITDYQPPSNRNCYRQQFNASSETTRTQAVQQQDRDGGQNPGNIRNPHRLQQSQYHRPVKADVLQPTKQSPHIPQKSAPKQPNAYRRLSLASTHELRNSREQLWSFPLVEQKVGISGKTVTTNDCGGNNKPGRENNGAYNVSELDRHKVHGSNNLSLTYQYSNSSIDGIGVSNNLTKNDAQQQRTIHCADEHIVGDRLIKQQSVMYISDDSPRQLKQSGHGSNASFGGDSGYSSNGRRSKNNARKSKPTEHSSDGIHGGFTDQLAYSVDVRRMKSNVHITRVNSDRVTVPEQVPNAFRERSRSDAQQMEPPVWLIRGSGIQEFQTCGASIDQQAYQRQSADITRL